MANTLNEGRSGVEITAMDSDYDFGDNVSLQAIKFYPGNVAGGEIVVFDIDATNIEICRLNTEDEEPRIEYFHGNTYRPYIDYEACTLNAGHKIVILSDRTYF